MVHSVALLMCVRNKSKNPINNPGFEETQNTNTILWTWPKQSGHCVPLCPGCPNCQQVNVHTKKKKKQLQMFQKRVNGVQYNVMDNPPIFKRDGIYTMTPTLSVAKPGIELKVPTRSSSY